jgi:hypothetical protein
VGHCIIAALQQGWRLFSGSILPAEFWVKLQVKLHINNVHACVLKWGMSGSVLLGTAARMLCIVLAMRSTFCLAHCEAFCA